MEHLGGVPAGADLVFPVGSRVMTKEGFPGVVEDAHEGLGPYGSTYFVTLDSGMGGGEYAEAELRPLADPRAASVERTAADDYPELGNILVERPPLAETVPAETYFGGRVTSISRTATSDEARDWSDAEAHEDMEGEGYLDPPYPEDVALAMISAVIGDAACKCCAGTGEHADGHECYVCDASGQASEAGGEVCEGHHERPDHSELSAERGVFHEAAAMVHCDTCDVDYAIDSEDDKHEHSKTSMADIPALPDWAWESQKDQYPTSGPEGISYFKGEIDARTWVDCLLYFKGGQLVGVLNHFPKDMGPERKGNVLVLVDPAFQRQGIGSALLTEAVKRWDVDPHRQDHTPAGKAMVKRLFGAKSADLYLPLDNEPTSTHAPGALSGEEGRGFQDGFADATSQAMKNPRDDNGLYRAGYDLGWAEGVKHAPLGGGMPMTTPEDLEARLSSAVDLPMPGLRAEGGVWDLITGSPEPSKNWAGPGRNWSFDWCRFRRESHCWFAKDLDEAATKEAGYAVWIPVDRGNCPRVTWDLQKKCPIGEPGPNVPGGYTDATVPWEQGGQRQIYSMSLTDAPVDPDFRWHVTASWADVRSKAKRIRSEGGVRILSARDGQVTAHVQGDTNVYQTTLTRVPGKQTIAFWECGCAWGAYAFGRSGRWKRFEGRLCSHALAANYEAQSRGMFGKTITEDTRQPEWMDSTIPVKTPGDWDRNKARYSTVRVVEAAYEDLDDEDPPVFGFVQGLLSEGRTAEETADRLAHLLQIHPTLAAEITKSAAAPGRGFKARVRNMLRTLFVRDRQIVDENGDPVPVRAVVYPTWDPDLGLSLTDRRRAMLTTAMPAPSVTFYAHRDSGGTALIKRVLSPVEATFYFWDPAGGGWTEDNEWASSVVMGSKALTEIPYSEVEAVKAEIGHGPHLAGLSVVADLEQAAQALVHQSFANEARISPMLKGAAEVFGGDLRGYKYRVKGHVFDPDKGFVPSGRTVQSKIERLMRSKGISADAAINAIDDSLRYTVTFPDGKYAAGVARTLSMLHQAGHSVVLGMGRNYWKQGDDYQGINVAMMSPDGVKWELQFHTPKSFKVKMGNHVLYEKFSAESDPVQRARIWDEMVANAATVPSPPGARDISRHFLRDSMHPAPKAAAMADSEWNFLAAQDEHAETPGHPPRTAEADEAWAMMLPGMGLLPGEPTYDHNPVVWAGPNGGMHGTLPGVDAADAFADSWATPAVQSGVDEDPDAALPVTYGDDEDETEQQARQAVLVALEAAESVQARYYTAEEMRQVGQAEVERTGRSAEDLLAAHQARLAAAAEGVEVEAPDPFAHLKAGTPSPDVANAAQAFLATTALANFSPAERAQIIEEGEGVTAANLGDLDISGTHYEALERRRATEDEADPSFLW